MRLPEPLELAFPALFSHSTEIYARIHDVLYRGLELALRNRLTPAAHSELAVLTILLQDVALSTSDDVRTLIDGSPFSTGGAYALLNAGEADDNAEFIWSTQIPYKVKIFGWLLYRDRLNTNVSGCWPGSASDFSLISVTGGG